MRKLVAKVPQVVHRVLRIEEVEEHRRPRRDRPEGPIRRRAEEEADESVLGGPALFVRPGSEGEESLQLGIDALEIIAERSPEPMLPILMVMTVKLEVRREVELHVSDEIKATSSTFASTPPPSYAGVASAALSSARS